MNILIVCSNCGSRFKGPESAGGRKTKCSKCGASLLVPVSLSPNAGGASTASRHADAAAPQQEAPQRFHEDRHSPGPPPIPALLEANDDPASFSTFLPHDRTGISDAGIDRDRPLGVVLIAIYSAINALSSLALWYMCAIVGAVGESQFMGGSQFTVGLLAMTFLAVSVFQTAVSYGLFTLQKWSYKLAIIVYGVIGVNALFGILATSASPNNIQLVLVPQIAMAVVVNLYFSQPSLKTYFRR